MIAFMQQGGQLKDVMGGVKETFVKLAPIVFSATGAFVVGATAVGVLGYAMYSGRKEFDDFNKSIILTGNYSKVTADDFGKMATKISTSSRATVGDAKDILNTMISSGQFTSKAFDSVSKVIQRFSELMGTSAKDAANKLIPSLDGSASSAKRLNDQYNFLTLAQYKHIEALERQGKTQESIIYTADLLNKSFTGARTELGYIDSALDYTTKKWSEFWNAAMNLGKPDSPQEKLKKIEDELRKAKGNKTEITASGWAGGEQRKFNARNDARIQELEYEKMALEENIRLAAKKNDLTGQKEKIDNRAKSSGLSADLALEKQLNDARRELKYASLMDSADEETKIIYKSAKKQEKLYSDHLETLTGKDQEFDSKRSQIYLAEMQREMVERDQKLEEFRLKQIGKEVDAAQAERFARKKIADEEYKQDLEKLITQADYYAKAKDTAGVEKDKLQAQIKMVGLSEKQVKLAESEAKYQEDIAKNKLIPGITADGIDALNKQAAAVKAARDNNIMLGDSLKNLQVVNDVVWSNITDAIDNFVNAGGKSFEDFAKNAIKQLMLIQTKKQALALWDQVGGVGGILSFGATMLGFADGGSPPVNTPSIVGERGPEIFIPRTAGTIIPNSAINSMGGGQTINYNGPYIANMSAIDTQSGAQFLAKNKQAVWATYQSANRSIPMSR
jgi:phage-related minor tail protein